MSLDRRREDLAHPWRVGKTEQENLADTVKSTNKEGNTLIKYSTTQCLLYVSMKEKNSYIIPVVKQVSIQRFLPLLSGNK